MGGINEEWIESSSRGGGAYPGGGRYQWRMNWKGLAGLGIVRPPWPVSMKNELKAASSATTPNAFISRYQWRMNWKVSPLTASNQSEYSVSMKNELKDLKFIGKVFCL